jgi:hypothetical protein
MNLTTFSTEQLHLFVHILEGISRQLDDISLAHLSEEDQKRRETLTAQAYVLNEQLTLEIAHRSLLHLHEQVGIDQSTTLEIANHALVSLQKQGRGGERT